jgi:hypothetical protein
MNDRNSYNWLRWIARVTGLLLVSFTLIIFIGESIESQHRQPGSELASYTPLILIIFFFWAIALASLVLALWKEGTGGLISLVSFFIMYILNLFNKEASMRGNAISVFLIFSVPSILYLIYWKLKKDELNNSDKTKTEKQG